MSKEIKIQSVNSILEETPFYTCSPLSLKLGQVATPLLKQQCPNSSFPVMTLSPILSQMEFAPKGTGSFAAYQHGLTAKTLAPNNLVISSQAIQKFNFQLEEPTN